MILASALIYLVFGLYFAIDLKRFDPSANYIAVILVIVTMPFLKFVWFLQSL